MSKTAKIIIIAAVIALAAGAFFLKENKEGADGGRAAAGSASVPTDENNAAGATQNRQLPRLVDLGASKCVPCKMMEPILEELKHEYDDAFTVQFIDVWQQRDKAREYGIRVIPTQIFYDAEGNELYRHEGFFSKADILDTWETHGVEINAKN